MQQLNDDRYEFILECLIGLSCLFLAGQLWGNKGMVLGEANQSQTQTTTATNQVEEKPGKADKRAKGSGAEFGNEKAILPLARMKPPGRKSSYGWRIHPTTGERQFHNGHDVGAAQGTPILSIFSGVVETTGFIGACGNTVKVRSGKYLVTYCHIMPNGILVREGQQVKQGDVIAKVGTTGRSTGPHLHIGIKVNGQDVNPLTVLPGWF